ncbi:hypothetical protein LOC70_12765 [Rhodopirellula sp. JC737]|nr:hypothetical protein [Rhodopirellula sp. JC737]MCC9656676.1 hypothetical protein [Rhodopirellula sp. JC737]
MKFALRPIALLSAIAVAMGVVAPVDAATTDTQKFTANVAVNMSVTAPSDAVLTHDETDANQAFTAQPWSVIGNSQNGVSVSFATNGPFVNTADATFKRDAKLGLSINSQTGPGAFTVSQATAQTDYANSVNVATVSAVSDGVSNATLDLSVEFITGTFGTFAAGTYETIVTGTITAL